MILEKNEGDSQVPAPIVQLMTMHENGSASLNQFQMVIPLKQKRKKLDETKDAA